MGFGRKNVYDFLLSRTTFQLQSNFEFRYPKLFDDNSFLIDQINMPQLSTKVGMVYLDGLQIPVHSAPEFGDNELTFTMYVPEKFLEGPYGIIFQTILDKNHDITKWANRNRETGTELPGKDGEEKMINAYIIPTESTTSKDELYPQYGTCKSDDASDVQKGSPYNTIVLRNAIIKSITFSGGFSANSVALLKFDVTMTFSCFDMNNFGGAYE